MSKLLVHLGMGGHTSQILRVVQGLGKSYTYEYVVGHDDQTSAAKIPFPGSIHRMLNPRLMTDTSLLKVAWQMIPATRDAWKILRSIRPDAIISTGPALAIPLFWLAKFLGIKTIFIESWVRVEHSSLAGRLVYPVSSLFFVQWPTMKKVFPKAIYAGRLS